MLFVCIRVDELFLSNAELTFHLIERLNVITALKSQNCKKVQQQFLPWQCSIFQEFAATNRAMR